MNWTAFFAVSSGLTFLAAILVTVPLYGRLESGYPVGRYQDAFWWLLGLGSLFAAIAAGLTS